MRRGALAMIGLLTAVVGGCDAQPDPSASVEPNRALRAVVESPAPVAPQSTRRGYDAAGHLKAAEGLVQGFEVPMGLELVRRASSFLEFRIRASMKDLRTFYTGVEPDTKVRFARRGYAIDDGVNGFSAHHTSESLRRLGLDERYEKVHVFVTTDRNRWKRVRVHTLPTEQTEAEPSGDHAAAPVAERSEGGAKPPARAPGQGGATKKKATGDNGTRAGSGQDAPPSTAVSVAGQSGGSSRSPARRPGASRPKRWGPYPPSMTKDPTPKIREWQRNNPGKQFLD